MNIDILIYDNLGRLIENTQQRLESGYNYLNHNISRLSKGNYHIRVVSSDQKHHDQKE